MEIRTSSRQKLGATLLAFTMFFAVEGCRKKTPPPVTPPPPAEAPKPAPVKPSISRFDAEPSTIERGQSATLSWAVSGEATDITITPGVGTVAASGSRAVYPSNTQTYTLTATGPGGTDTRTVSVNVQAPAPPPPPPAPKPQVSISEMLASQVQDIYFDYDRSDIREDARATLTRNADALKNIMSEFPNAAIIVEGHADERGSAEYNMGLSDRRATAVREFLGQLGVSGDRLRVVSYGKERPQCTESNEDCWQRNRRAHFSAGQ